MYKYCLILFLFFSSLLLGREPIKSKDAEGPEEKIISKLYDLEQNLEINPEQTIKLLDDITKLAINKGYRKPVSYGYLLLARSYSRINQPDLALHFINLSDQNWKRSHKYLKKKDARNYNVIRSKEYYKDRATIHEQLGDNNKALVNYKLYQKLLKDRGEILNVDYLIAKNHYAIEEYPEAISYYEQLLKYEKSQGDVNNVALCYSRLAACYISIGDIEKGLTFYKLSTQDIVNRSQFNDNKELVSKALSKVEKYDEEALVRNSALDVINDGLEYLRLAQTYFNAKKHTKAEASLDKYFQDISYDLIDLKEIEVIKELSYVLDNKKNKAKALNYAYRYQELTDTINNHISSLTLRSQQIGEAAKQNILEFEILKKDKEMSENTINHLVKESELKEDLVGFQKTIIYLLCGIIVLVVVAFIYIVNVSKQRRIANQQLALRSLRSQMNPHFIFNALNSVNSFISESDERSANKFLTEFSTLMRTVMENSEHAFIPLSKELEILKIYIGLEHFRFKDKFDYSITIDESIDEEAFVIPPMLIQPFIENAIWHGLRYKKSLGKLTVKISLANNKELKIIVEDNGIGRAKSQELKTKNQKKNKSTAIKNIEERIKIFNSLHKEKVHVSTADLFDDGSGTVVTLIISQPNYA